MRLILMTPEQFMILWGKLQPQARLLVEGLGSAIRIPGLNAICVVEDGPLTIGRAKGFTADTTMADFLETAINRAYNDVYSNVTNPESRAS